MQSFQDIDEYIAHAPAEMRAILARLREIFRQASPKLEEAIKWGVPFFVYMGPVGGFAAYKKHVSWGLMKARLLQDPDGILGRGIMMGGKITSVAEMPAEGKLIGLIRQAVALNEAGIHPVTPDPEVPADFAAALRRSQKAATQFAAFTAARKWQYVNWINKAKRAETRAKRIEAAVDRISAGKAMK